MGLKVGSCLTLKKELLENTHKLQSKKFYWEGAPMGRAERQGNQGEERKGLLGDEARGRDRDQACRDLEGGILQAKED